MNVLIVLPTDSLNGAEQYLKMIARCHQKDKVTIFFLKKSVGNRWGDLPDSISLEYLSESSYLKGLLSFLAFQGFRKRKCYDRIYTSHLYITGLVGACITFRLLLKKRFIARESTSVFPRFKGLKLLSYQLTYLMGYRHIDLLISQTEFMKKQLIAGFPAILKRTKIEVIENPIDMDLIRSRENTAFEIAPPQKFIVSAGRLIPEKGYDNLIKAFARIKSDFPDIDLLILGDGPEKEHLLSLAKEKHVETCVHLPGRVQNVYPYFKKASVCVVSSRIEGFPNVLLQMMSQNNQIVSTLCAGGIENIPNIGKVPPEDTTVLADSIQLALKSKVSRNRVIFDQYLQRRDISSFMKKLKILLETDKSTGLD